MCTHIFANILFLSSNAKHLFSLISSCSLYLQNKGKKITDHIYQISVHYLNKFSLNKRYTSLYIHMNTKINSRPVRSSPKEQLFQAINKLKKNVRDTWTFFWKSTAVIWLKHCLKGVKHYSINQSKIVKCAKYLYNSNCYQNKYS